MNPAWGMFHVSHMPHFQLPVVSFLIHSILDMDANPFPEKIAHASFTVSSPSDPSIPSWCETFWDDM